MPLISEKHLCDLLRKCRSVDEIEFHHELNERYVIEQGFENTYSFFHYLRGGDQRCTKLEFHLSNECRKSLNERESDDVYHMRTCLSRFLGGDEQFKYLGNDTHWFLIGETYSEKSSKHMGLLRWRLLDKATSFFWVQRSGISRNSTNPLVLGDGVRVHRGHWVVLRVPKSQEIAPKTYYHHIAEQHEFETEAGDVRYDLSFPRIGARLTKRVYPSIRFDFETMDDVKEAHFGAWTEAFVKHDAAERHRVEESNKKFREMKVARENKRNEDKDNGIASGNGTPEMPDFIETICATCSDMEDFFANIVPDYGKNELTGKPRTKEEAEFDRFWEKHHPTVYTKTGFLRKQYLRKLEISLLAYEANSDSLSVPENLQRQPLNKRHGRTTYNSDSDSDYDLSDSDYSYVYWPSNDWEPGMKAPTLSASSAVRKVHRYFVSADEDVVALANAGLNRESGSASPDCNDKTHKKTAGARERSHKMRRLDRPEAPISRDEFEQLVTEYEKVRIKSKVTRRKSDVHSTYSKHLPRDQLPGFKVLWKEYPESQKSAEDSLYYKKIWLKKIERPFYYGPPKISPVAAIRTMQILFKARLYAPGTGRLFKMAEASFAGNAERLELSAR